MRTIYVSCCFDHWIKQTKNFTLGASFLVGMSSALLPFPLSLFFSLFLILTLSLYLRRNYTIFEKDYSKLGEQEKSKVDLLRERHHHKNILYALPLLAVVFVFASHGATNLIKATLIS
jgi:hypothetical protein